MYLFVSINASQLCVWACGLFQHMLLVTSVINNVNVLKVCNRTSNVRALKDNLLWALKCSKMAGVHCLSGPCFQMCMWSLTLLCLQMYTCKEKTCCRLSCIVDCIVLCCVQVYTILTKLAWWSLFLHSGNDGASETCPTTTSEYSLWWWVCASTWFIQCWQDICCGNIAGHRHTLQPQTCWLQVLRRLLSVVQLTPLHS